jgi:uncharacterized phage protein (TIGR02218 family)
MSEVSAASSQPVEVYEFVLGSSTFRFTSSPIAVEVDGEEYLPLEMSRSRLVGGSDERSESLVITIPRHNLFAQRYIGTPPGQSAVLTIRRAQAGDLSDFIMIFKGTVRSVSFTNDGASAQIGMQPVTAGLSREIPRYTFQSLCNHSLYETPCGVLESAFTTRLVVSAQAGNVLTIPGLSSRPNGYYDSGFIRRDNGEYRMVQSHLSNSATILLPFSHNLVGEEIAISAGCDRSYATCSSKFANVRRFGGHPYLPEKNPFSTGVE